MEDVEKVELAGEKYKEKEISGTEVSITSIFYLLEKVTEKGEEVKLNYNQLREDFRKMPSKSFNILAETMAEILEIDTKGKATEDKKKDTKK
jgi:hypothetical protein